VHSSLQDRGLEGEVLVLSGVSTGVSICLEGPGRDRTFISMRGALDRFGARMVPDDVVRSPFLLVCGYFTLKAMRGEPMRDLLEHSRAAQATVLLDPDVEPGGWSNGAREEIGRLLPMVDGFLPNQHEASGLTGIDDPVAAGVDLHRRCGGWVVVKRGAEGAAAIDPTGSVLRIDAPPVEVVDTTGAGDAFNAGVLFGLSKGWTWPEALSFAARLGSTVAARPATDRHPSLNEVLPAGGRRYPGP
jgi:argininosuccinate lyase